MNLESMLLFTVSAILAPYGKLYFYLNVVRSFIVHTVKRH